MNTTAAAPCPGPRSDLSLRTRWVDFDAVPRRAWDRLLAVTPFATPFAGWTFHRAWWDAYGETATARYLVCERAGDGQVVGIVPLMTQPGRDADGRALQGPPTMFMAASYHADYATILSDPADLAEVAEAAVAAVCDEPATAWHAIDLRRLRTGDPTADVLARAFREGPRGWRATLEQEDVCPVVTLPSSGDWEDYLATLDKKARHEIRRKLRRAEAVGPVRFREVPLEAASADAFIALHQARWGDQGLFPDTPDGDRSRRFLHRLTALEAAEGDRAQLVLGEVTVAGRVVVATVAFDDGATCFFYNAGMDPGARELSPGVTGTAAYIRDRLAAGRARFDFLRGDEPYKYEWGAVDEPVHRLLVTRS